MTSRCFVAASCTRVWRVFFARLALLLLISSSAIAGIVVPSGGSFSLNGGEVSLGETPLGVAGTLQVGAGEVTGISNVAIASTGTLSATSGLIELSGNWQVLGAFNSGSGEVRFIDGSTTEWFVLGSTQFASLSISSSIGKHFVVEPGSVQSIAQLLTIMGTAAFPVQIERRPEGEVGRFDLQSAGTQAIANVGVSNVHAIGQPLAPTQSNQGGSGNAIGWFGTVLEVPPLPIPTNSPLALILISLLMVLVASRFGPPSISRSS